MNQEDLQRELDEDSRINNSQYTFQYLHLGIIRFSDEIINQLNEGKFNLINWFLINGHRIRPWFNNISLYWIALKGRRILLERFFQGNGTVTEEGLNMLLTYIRREGNLIHNNIWRIIDQNRSDLPNNLKNLPLESRVEWASTRDSLVEIYELFYRGLSVNIQKGKYIISTIKKSVENLQNEVSYRNSDFLYWYITSGYRILIRNNLDIFKYAIWSNDIYVLDRILDQGGIVGDNVLQYVDSMANSISDEIADRITENYDVYGVQFYDEFNDNIRLAYRNNNYEGVIDLFYRNADIEIDDKEILLYAISTSYVKNGNDYNADFIYWYIYQGFPVYEIIRETIMNKISSYNDVELLRNAFEQLSDEVNRIYEPVGVPASFAQYNENLEESVIENSEEVNIPIGSAENRCIKTDGDVISPVTFDKIGVSDNIVMFYYPEMNSYHCIEYNSWSSFVNGFTPKYIVDNNNETLYYYTLYKTILPGNFIVSSRSLINRYNTFYMKDMGENKITGGDKVKVYMPIPINRSQLVGTQELLPENVKFNEELFVPENIDKCPNQEYEYVDGSIVLLQRNGSFSEVDPLQGMIIYHFTTQGVLRNNRFFNE